MTPPPSLSLSLQRAPPRSMPWPLLPPRSASPLPTLRPGRQPSPDRALRPGRHRHPGRRAPSGLRAPADAATWASEPFPTCSPRPAPPHDRWRLDPTTGRQLGLGPRCGPSPFFFGGTVAAGDATLSVFYGGSRFERTFVAAEA